MVEESKLQVPGEFDLIDWEIPPIVGDWRSHDWPDLADERIATIREEFALDEVIVDAEGDLAQILALKRWVRSRWDHGWSFAYRTVENALDILREAARGEKFNCGHYSRVFVACAAALGIPARTAHLALADCSFPRGHDVGNVGHCVAEAWCNELSRWIVTDCDLNLHYERERVPLSALDVHDAWLSGESGQVTPVYEEPSFVVPSGRTVEILGEIMPECRGLGDELVALKFVRFGRRHAMDYYARLRIGGMEWLDPRRPPTFVRHFEPGPAVRYTDHAADMYPTLNAVGISAGPCWDEHGATLSITLDHCMPWFDRFEVRFNGSEWESIEESFSWQMREGPNRLEVRAVNRCGRPGSVSAIEVAYAAPVW